MSHLRQLIAPPGQTLVQYFQRFCRDQLAIVETRGSTAPPPAAQDHLSPATALDAAARPDEQGPVAAQSPPPVIHHHQPGGAAYTNATKRTRARRKLFELYGT